jgi:hypothetical protein
VPSEHLCLGSLWIDRPGDAAIMSRSA